MNENVNLQALEQLPNLKKLFLFPERTGMRTFDFNNAFIDKLKCLSLPAGVKLLQEESVGGGFFVELGCFQRYNNLAGTMAAMETYNAPGMENRTMFVMNQGSQLSRISAQYLLTQFESMYDR